MATYTPASMALTSGGTLTATPRNLQDAQAQRIINAQRVILGMPPAATAQQVWTELEKRRWDTLKAEAVNFEYQQSIAAVVKTDIAET